MVIMLLRRLGRLSSATLFLLFSTSGLACHTTTDTERREQTEAAFRAGTDGIVCAHYRKYAVNGGWGSDGQFDDTEQCAAFGSDLAPLYGFAQNQGIARDAYRWGHVTSMPVLSFDVRTEPWLTFEDDASVSQFVTEQDRVVAYLANVATAGPPDYDSDRTNFTGLIGLVAEYDALMTATARIEGQIRSVRRQHRAVVANVDDAIASLRARVLAPSADPAVRDAVMARATAERLRRQLDTLIPEASALPATLSDSVGAFAALHSHTNAANDEIRSLVEQGSNATLAEIGTIEQKVRDWGSREAASCDVVSEKARSAAVEARGVAADLQSIGAALGPLRAQGVEIPALPVGVADAMDAVATWAELRKGNVRAVEGDTFNGLAERREALIQRATDDATRATLSATGSMKAAQLFTDEQTRRSEDLLRLPPTTARLKAPLLSEKLDAAVAYSQLRATCDGDQLDATAWRYAGCQILLRNAGRADTFRTSTTPLLLRLNAATLRRGGVAEARVQELERLVASGSLAAAAAMSDALLLTIDGRSVPVNSTSQDRTLAPSALVGSASSTRAVASSQVLRARKLNTSALQAPSTTWQTGLNAIASVKSRRAQGIATLRQAISNRGTVYAHATALRDAIAEIDQVIASGQLSIGRAEIEQVLNRHGDLDPSVRNRLLTIWDELGSNLTSLRTDAASEMQLALTGVASLRASSSQAADAVATVPGATNYDVLAVDTVSIPLVTSTGTIDDPGAYITTFANRVVSDLRATIGSGAVLDRGRFLSTLSAFVRNSAALEQSLASRGATAPGEREALAAARAGVAAVAAPYLSASGWFLDTTASAPLRATLDGGFGGHASAESAVIKRAINTWAPAPTSTGRARVLASLDAIRTASVDASVELSTPANLASLRTVLAASAIAATEEGALFPGTFGSFCAAITGAGQCQGADLALTRGERVAHALSVDIRSAAFWQAVPSTGEDVGPRVAKILSANASSSNAEIRELVDRFGGAALDGLAGESREAIVAVSAKTGDEAVRRLGASVSIDDLRALDALSFLRPTDASARSYAETHGGAAKAMPALSGRSADEVRTLLASSGFVLRSPGSMELWVHGDGSAVRIATGGSPELPAVAQAARFILGSSGAPVESNAVASLHDSTSRVLPAWSADADAAFAAWFRTTRALRAPTTSESTVLRELWLARTRPTLSQ